MNLEQRHHLSKAVGIVLLLTSSAWLPVTQADTLIIKPLQRPEHVGIVKIIESDDFISQEEIDYYNAIEPDEQSAYDPNPGAAPETPTKADWEDLMILY